MRKTLELPLREGLAIPAAVLMDAAGPAALAPAQATQFCQPLILWIWDFTVCADERRDAADSANKEITRTDRVLVVFFNITTFLLQGIVFYRPQSCRDEVGD